MQMARIFGDRRVNPNWDSRLTTNQRALLTTPGFGIVEKLPYLPEEDVKKIMDIIEKSIEQVGSMINASRQ